MAKIDRDLMNMASVPSVANATLATLDHLQDFRPHVQILAAAAVFLNLADHLRVSPQDAFSAVTNLMNDKDGQARPEFRAVRSYMEHELP